MESSVPEEKDGQDKKEQSNQTGSWFQLSMLRNFYGSESNEERTYFALTLLTGAVSACIAVSIYKITHFLTALFGTNDSFTTKAFIFGLVSTIVSGLLTTKKFPLTAGSGIPGVRVALAVHHGRLKIQDTIAKYVTSILSLAAGFSLGREGPTVAISSGVGSFLGEFFHLSKRRVKALVAIGSAGGIAAAFSTPMAAVVFTLEEIVGDLNAKMLGSIIISSVVASVVGQALIGSNSSYFTQLNYHLNDARELILYLFVGILASILGTLWMKTVLKYRKFALNILKGHKFTLIIITFFVMAGISHINPKVLGSGHGTIEDALLSLILDWRVLLGLFVLKFFATTLSYGSGISGGLFMPTLLMGAMLGGFVGSVAKMIFPEFAGNIGAFALIGMGAYFAAVIRAPFTSIIIVFELTRDYNIILPLMIANIASYFLASKFHHGSIYENISEQDGIHLPTKEDNEILESMVVEDAMMKDVITLSHNLPIKEALKKVKNSPITGYPVLKQGLLVGMVSTSDIASAFAKRKKGQSTVGDICIARPIKIYPDQSLLVALHLMNNFGVSRLPVVSRLNDKFIIGIITPQDIVQKFGLSINEPIEKKELPT